MAASVAVSADTATLQGEAALDTIRKLTAIIPEHVRASHALPDADRSDWEVLIKQSKNLSASIAGAVTEVRSAWVGAQMAEEPGKGLVEWMDSSVAQEVAKALGLIHDRAKEMLRDCLVNCHKGVEDDLATVNSATTEALQGAALDRAKLHLDCHIAKKRLMGSLAVL